MRERGYTVLEMIACVVVMALMCILIAPSAWKVYESSALAVSANNIRQLTAGAMHYLAENDHRFWKFRQDGITVIDEFGNPTRGTRYWFGFESSGSAGSGEGNRAYDPSKGPLAGYVPMGLRPDPSFATGAAAFKPKYKSGYLGVGYNGVLGGGFSTKKKPLSYWELSDPAKVVIFATSAQVNTFQSPASPDQPMIEEFYLIDERETTVHFQSNGMAMVGFADGACGFLPIDESTRDPRMPEANIGRFAPRGSFQYLK